MGWFTLDVTKLILDSWYYLDHGGTKVRLQLNLLVFVTLWSSMSMPLYIGSSMDLGTITIMPNSRREVFF